MGYYSWPKYVPVHERRAKARRKMEKLKKKGMKIQPVELEKRTIAKTFWGKAWCDHMESFSDYDNRLPRGRTYVRNGSVCHLEVQKGLIKAIVSGSELYEIKINVKPLSKDKWKKIKSTCAGQVGSLLDLLSGKLSNNVMEVVCNRQSGLFPKQSEISLNCNCPDWADMCKHIAAALYGVGARLDLSPKQLFLLRGVNHEELVDVSDAVAKVIKGKDSSGRRIEGSSISDIFDIDLSNAKTIPDKKLKKTTKNKQKKKSSADISSKKTKQQKPRVALKKAKPTKKRSKIKPKEKNNNKDSIPKYLSGFSIRKKREFLEMTKTAFAKKIGVSASTILQWENKGRKKINPRQDVLKKLHKLSALKHQGRKFPQK